MATRCGLLAWRSDKFEDRLWTRFEHKTISLNWIYLYGRDGITIDRQIAQLKFNSTELAFVWGTRGMCEVLELMRRINPSWHDHLERISGWTSSLTSRLALAEGELHMRTAKREYDRDTKMLTLLAAATQSRRLNWLPLAKNVFGTKLENAEITIELLHAVTGKPRLPSLQFVRLTYPGVIEHIGPGTEAMALVENILAHCDDEWRSHFARRDIETRSMVAKLKASIAEDKVNKKQKR